MHFPALFSENSQSLTFTHQPYLLGKQIDNHQENTAMSLAEYLTAESTTVECKESLNSTKPKSWLKTISAFANTEGGIIIVGVSDKRELLGVENIQKETARAAEVINAHIEPVPRYHLLPVYEDGKDYLIIQIPKGTATPYYYSSNGTRIPYIRLGDESITAPQHILHSLILQGMNQTFDALPSPYKLEDVSFTYLKATFRQRLNDNTITDRDLTSFGLVLQDGQLTYAGALLCDQPVISQSRIFCTRWKNLSKGTIGEDALDDKEYEGNLLSLLENAELFVKNNSQKSWGVTGMVRDELEDYPISAVREALINALIHRDYQILGSEIHIDIYPDRLEITSPGGMMDGSKIQALNIADIPSMRRNKVLSDIFSRLHIMERRGSGLTRIIEGYDDVELKPDFYSDMSFFRVTMPNKRHIAESEIHELHDVYVSEIITPEISDAEKEILSLITSTSPLTIPKAAKKLGLSVKQARKLFESLKKKQYITHTGSRKSGCWIILRADKGQIKGR